MNADWREASVELVDGYEVTGPDGRPTREVARALVAIEGGFAHLNIPGTGVVQTVSAPAIRVITFQPNTGGAPRV
ncbi:hypothetical protein GCM10010193_32900 [Kitasatospora atroaurantiaca]|uniref:Uncharacterized protein n=1 Tax=Kitasatospora atroaurantiaca TaxID=285545 RepID=A0A561ERN3_9ACTN|nr:hypothetical protein [Kitasatospora atroaurantiaca]TWE18271.1 hypothetical protein FB465_3329 [Kitasatospora atroaurantiaca]